MSEESCPESSERSCRDDELRYESLEAEIDLLFVERTVTEHAPLDLPVQLQRHFDEIFRG